MIIIKDILSYYDNETKLLKSVNDNLIEYKKIKTLYLINFYTNVLYLYYNNLYNLKIISEDRLILKENITTNYPLDNFLDKYSFFMKIIV